MEKMEKTHAGLYLRLSREDENENSESNSITNQRMLTSCLRMRLKGSTGKSTG